LPDIYLVLLDAYPRSDTLASDFSIDNGPFPTDALDGLDLSANSHQLQPDGADPGLDVQCRPRRHTAR
jgi:hypothetical protein